MSLFLKQKITFIIAITVDLSLAAGVNLPSHGDNAVLQRIAADNIPTDGKIWDFSQCELTGEEPEVRFDRSGDTCLSATLPGIRYDFEIRGDTLFRVAKETHFVRISDTIPMPYVVPSAGKEFVCSYASRGRAYHSEYIDATGSVSISDIARGTIILPSRDTIADVTLTRHRSSQYIASAFNSRPVADADSTMSLLHRTTVTCNWHSPELPVPVAQFTEVTDSIGDRQRGTTMRSAWICPPSCQPVRSLANRASCRNSKPSYNTDPGDNIGAIDNLIIEIDGDNVSVSGIVSSGGNVDIILTDIIGRVYASAPTGNYSAGDIVEWQSGDLPAGQYLLHINCGSRPSITRKIIIR